MKISKNEINPLLSKFIEHTVGHLGFLEREFGFSCTEKEVVNQRYAVVIYQSDEVLIQMSFNSYSFEIGFEMSQRMLNARKFLLGDLVRFYKEESNLGFVAPQASTPERLEKTISAIANFLKQKCSVFFRGDTAAFGALEEFIKKPAKSKLPI